MRYHLTVSHEQLSDEDLSKLTLQLCQTIHRETDLEANQAQQPGKPGEKGAAVSLGTIVLTALTTGAVGALFGVLKSYVERDRTIVLEVPQEGGPPIRFSAQNLTRSQFNRAFGIVEQALDPRP